MMEWRVLMQQLVQSCAIDDWYNRKYLGVASLSWKYWYWVQVKTIGQQIEGQIVMMRINGSSDINWLILQQHSSFVGWGFL
jgi:hypothetical protein